MTECEEKEGEGERREEGRKERGERREEGEERGGRGERGERREGGERKEIYIPLLRLYYHFASLSSLLSFESLFCS